MVDVEKLIRKRKIIVNTINAAVQENKEILKSLTEESIHVLVSSCEIIKTSKKEVGRCNSTL